MPERPSVWKRTIYHGHLQEENADLAIKLKACFIALCSCKVYRKKISVNDMISFLENQDLLSMQQFGLKSNGSASDLLLSMTTEWSKALEKGTDSHDIAGAFAKLRGYGVSGQYLPSCRLPQGKKISYCIKLSFLK